MFRKTARLAQSLQTAASTTCAPRITQVRIESQADNTTFIWSSGETSTVPNNSLYELCDQAGSIKPAYRLSNNETGTYAVADCDIRAETTIYKFEGELVEGPDMYTIQIHEALHIDTPGVPRFTAHSCDPNCRIRYTKPMEIASGPTSQLRGANDWIVELVAIKDIKNGDGFSFHYCSTEYAMDASFSCKCGSPKCIGNVRGYKFLSEDQKSNRLFQPLLSPYILSLSPPSAE